MGRKKKPFRLIRDCNDFHLARAVADLTEKRDNKIFPRICEAIDESGKKHFLVVV